MGWGRLLPVAVPALRPCVGSHCPSGQPPFRLVPHPHAPSLHSAPPRAARQASGTRLSALLLGAARPNVGGDGGGGTSTATGSTATLLEQEASFGSRVVAEGGGGDSVTSRALFRSGSVGGSRQMGAESPAAAAALSSVADGAAPSPPLIKPGTSPIRERSTRDPASPLGALQAAAAASSNPAPASAQAAVASQPLGNADLEADIAQVCGWEGGGRWGGAGERAGGAGGGGRPAALLTRQVRVSR